MNRNGRYRWPRSPLLLLFSILCINIVVCESESRARVQNDAYGVQYLLGNVFGYDAGSKAGAEAKAVADTQPENVPRIGRTFGVKRIQFMIMPMVYKMGVIMTMLTVLTVISLKGLVIGLILLVLKLSAIFGKLYASTAGHSANWSSPSQPVHVHLHNNGGGGGYSHQVYPAWDGGGGGGPPPDDGYYYRG